MQQPTINQYLLSTCLFVIDEMNELYKYMTKEELKNIADTKYNETDILVKIGYFFKQSVHYMVGEEDKKGYKINHDLYIENKDFMIEVKYLKNWECGSGSKSISKSWTEIQKDFD